MRLFVRVWHELSIRHVPTLDDVLRSIAANHTSRRSVVKWGEALVSVLNNG